VSDATGFPVEFGPDHNVAWQTEVPFGHSSPIVVGNRVYLTGSSDESLLTLALDRGTGDVLWRRETKPSRDDAMYRANDPASPTPASDGTHVYAFFQEMGLISYDSDGSERWRLELGPFDNFYGLASSPVIAGDLVLLLCDQVDGSFLLAVDKNSGEERWRANRAGRIESWSTPVLYPSETPEAVLVFGSNWVDSYDLWTGEPRWELPGVGGGPVASPVVAGTIMVVTAPNHNEQPLPGFAQLLADTDTDNDGALSSAEFSTVEGMGEHFGWMDRDNDDSLTAVEYGYLVELIETTPYGTMGISLPTADEPISPEIVWSVEKSIPYIATPVVYGDIAYLVRDGGIVQSVDVNTGEVFKRGRTSRSAGSIYASPVAADGKIVISSLEGEVAVLSAGEQWEVLAVNDLDEPIYASPALAGDRLFVRTSTRLYSFGTPN
jgi:outer membrane protein assembly factor BamB